MSDRVDADVASGKLLPPAPAGTCPVVASSVGLVASAQSTPAHPIASAAPTPIGTAAVLGRPGMQQRQRFDGCSIKDWHEMLAVRRRIHGGNGLANAAGQRAITAGELGSHCEMDDMWMAYKGKVYDITTWGRYHPGGREILADAAGRDGTALHDFYHRWVSLDQLLAPFLQGILCEPAEAALLPDKK